MEVTKNSNEGETRNTRRTAVIETEIRTINSKPTMFKDKTVSFEGTVSKVKKLNDSIEVTLNDQPGLVEPLATGILPLDIGSMFFDNSNKIVLRIKNSDLHSEKSKFKYGDVVEVEGVFRINYAESLDPYVEVKKYTNRGLDARGKHETLFSTKPSNE